MFVVWVDGAMFGLALNQCLVSVGAFNNRRTKILFISAIAELTHKLVCKVFAIHMPEYCWPHNSFIFSHIQNGKKHIQTLSSIDFELAYACGYMWINMIKDSYTQHTLHHFAILSVIFTCMQCLLNYVSFRMYSKFSVWSIGICFVYGAQIQSSYLLHNWSVRRRWIWEPYEFHAYMPFPIIFIEYLFGSTDVVAIIFTVYWCCKLSEI